MDQLVRSALSLGAQALWSEDPTAQAAISLVAVLAGSIFVLVFLPLLVRLGRLALLRRRLRGSLDGDDASLSSRREAMQTAFETSPVRGQWAEYQRRRAGSLLEGKEDLAALRFSDVLDEAPVLPTGARRSLLPVLPGLFLAIGILGTFAGFTLALGDLVPAGPPTVVTQGSAEPASPAAAPSPTLFRDLAPAPEPARPATAAPRRGAERERIANLVSTVGLALRSSLWGLLFSIFAALGGRWLEGRFDACAEALDALVERLYGSVSQGELATHFARFQAEGFDRLREELATTTRELGTSLDGGLGRIERSTAEAAGLVSQEQRAALARIVDEMSAQIRHGVDEHLGGLHRALEQAVSHQDEVTSGLELAFERMVQNSDAHQQVTRTLEEAAGTVREASECMDRSATSLEPVTVHLRETGDAIVSATERINHTQDLTTRSVESVRSSIEHTAGAMREQREFVEVGLREIRETLRHLSRGLGEELSEALRSVDDALEGSVGRLRETLLESNETIDRIALPMRAAEGTTREMQAALERARNEVTGLGDWLIQSLKPVRGSLAQLDDRTGTITRALVEFANQLRVIDKSIDALRASMQEEGRRFQATSSALGARIDHALGDLSNLDGAPLETEPLADYPALDDVDTAQPPREQAEITPAPPEAVTPAMADPPGAHARSSTPADDTSERAEELAPQAPAAGAPTRAGASPPSPPAPEPLSTLAPESGTEEARHSVFAPPHEAGASSGSGELRDPEVQERHESTGEAPPARPPEEPAPRLSRMHGALGLSSLLSRPGSRASSGDGPDEDQSDATDDTSDSAK